MVIKIVYPLYQEKATELLFNSKPNSIIMLHNHPGQSGFSLNDLGLYIKQNSVQTITIVTNKKSS